MNTSDVYTFSAAGGMPPYTFSRVGTVGSITPGGMFTAPATATPSTTVTVTDSVGATATATVVTVASGGGGPLVLSPANVAISENDTLILVASGGAPAYQTPTTSKGIASAIDPSTHEGTYAANGNLGNNTETVTDSASGSATSNITVNPSAPSNLTATAASSQEIDLSWTNNTLKNNGGINIYRAIGNGGFTLIASGLANTITTYSDTGLSSETVYVYRMASVKNGAGGPFYGYSENAVATTD